MFVQILRDTLKELSEFSGLVMDEGKSLVNFGGTHPITRKDIIDILNVKESILPFTYLDVPLTPKKPNIKDFEPLILSITACMKS